MPSEGWSTGQGKSTLAMQIMKKILMELLGYEEWVAEQYIKQNMLFNWANYYDMMMRGMYDQRVWCCCAEDFHEWAGKHMSHNKSIQWVAREHTKKRPYLGVFLATMEHIGSLGAAWRDGKWMFEIKLYEKGKYEVQYIKTKTNFRKPEEPYKILDKNTIKPVIGTFPQLTGELDEWYKQARDVANKESFRTGWTEHFGTNEPDAVPQELGTVDSFATAVRKYGISASNEKIRKLYTELIKPTIKVAKAAE